MKLHAIAFCSHVHAKSFEKPLPHCLHYCHFVYNIAVSAGGELRFSAEERLGAANDGEILQCQVRDN